MAEKSGGEFLNIKYPDLQKSDQVQKSVDKKLRIDGEKTPNDPSNRNEVFLKRLENIFDNPNEDTKQRNIAFFTEKFLYPNVLIDKDNVPDSYFELQLKIARERGQGGDLGNINNVKDIPEKIKRKTGETLYNDQKKSLETWVDYLSDKDSIYPTWFKYYTLRNVVKMGNYDKEKHEFGKRSKNSTGIFPDLNREALSYSYDVLEKHYLKHEKHDNEELNRILDTANFSKIYAFAIDKVTPASKENKEKTQGEWTKYNRGDDPTVLCDSLQGHGTHWCIAGEGVAREYLQKGDFYTYYSKDQDNKNTIPRIAIRMENGQVAEVRGVADNNQNLEANMLDIAKEKYHQLPGGEKFDKKDHDMKVLTQIDKKVQDSQELNKEELKFLYELDDKIEGFGYKKDSRIYEIIEKRNIKTDLAYALDCSQEQISTTEKEALKGDIKYHFDSLYLPDLTSAEGLKLPESVGGKLNLRGLTSAEGLKLPESVGGDLDLGGLTSAEGLKLPESVGGNLFLYNLGLDSPKDIKLICKVGGKIYIDNATSLLKKTYPNRLKIL